MCDERVCAIFMMDFKYYDRVMIELDYEDNDRSDPNRNIKNN